KDSLEPVYDRRRKDLVHSILTPQRDTGSESRRVTRQVVSTAELTRVHKETHDDRTARQTCPSDEGAVPGVKRSHRRHYPDHHSFSMECPTPGRKDRDRANRSHQTWLFAGA